MRKAEGIWEIYVLSFQFCCEPRAVLKSLIKKMELKKVLIESWMEANFCHYSSSNMF